MNNILNLLKEIKYSFQGAEKVFMEGSCFRLYRILKAIHPEAKPYYSQVDGHWITEIGGKYYDINGEIDKDYVVHRKYVEETNKLTLNSAYVPTYGGQSVGYDKYIESV